MNVTTGVCGVRNISGNITVQIERTWLAVGIVVVVGNVEDALCVKR